jgi:hypothetical protein
VGIVVDDGRGQWPALPPAAWKETRQTLHMYLQVIGKIRLGLMPKWNQWWNVTFYVTPRGFTTTSIPYGHRTFEIRLDFVDHALLLDTSEGARVTLPLVPRTVADFYRQVNAILNDLHLQTPIWPHPVEIPNPIPFLEDTIHCSYDREWVERFWTTVRQLDSLFQRFRGRFRGKCSPVHFFWGSFDLAVTRFSGKMAPERPGADLITADAYDEEVSSLGFWPGNEESGPVVYSYAAPEPSGFSAASILPAEGFYSPPFKEFLLPYDSIRNAEDPDALVLQFAESTYLAAATCAGWDIGDLSYTKMDAEPALASAEPRATSPQ